jgi:two-component system response regulator AtoC
LAEFLVRKYGLAADYPLLTAELRHAMMSHHWPGNVRELENFVRKLLILRTPDSLARELHLKAGRRALLSAPRAETRPPAENHHDEQNEPILEQVSKAKEQAESEAIIAALNSTRWNRKQAANLLKIDYKALLYKMKKLGIEDRPASFIPSTAFKRAAASGTPE